MSDLPWGLIVLPSLLIALAIGAVLGVGGCLLVSWVLS